MADLPSDHEARHILVIGAADGTVARLAPLLPPGSAVRQVSSSEEALSALAERSYDAVIASAADLIPLARAANRQIAGSILEGIAQGVAIVDHGGRLVWANATLRGYAPEVVEAVRAACAEALQELAVMPGEGEGRAAPTPGADPAGAAPAPRAVQRTLRVGTERQLELSVTAVAGVGGGIDEAIGLFSDTTAISRMREKLDAIDAAGRELVALNVDESAALDVGERLQLLEDKLIRYCRDLLHFSNFAVLVLDPKTRRLDTVVTGGFSESVKQLDIYASETGNGISGYVAATGRSYVCPDITSDPLYLPGLECASSSLTVPLRLVDRIVGVLNVESDKPAAFSDEDRQFAEILGRYVAVALHTLKLLAWERSETAGQVTADVSAELARPLDSIVAEVSRLMAEPPAEAALRARLAALIEQVDRVKQVLQARGKPVGIRGLVPEAPQTDPRLKARRVLIADDEDIIRETIADVLTKAGALPVTARDGEEAIAMLRSQRFDLVLSDIKMPHKSGYEVFAAAREGDRGTPVILITGFGYDPEHNIVRASREGLAAVLFKPFKVEQLIDAMHKALAPAG